MKELLSLIAALVLIASGAAWAGEQKKQQTGTESEQSTVGEYIDDTMITTKVKAALAKDPGTSALTIGVETTQGTVQLSGSVDSAEEKMKAESIARGVEGVRAVENKLTVK